jgi:hypothetical protein
LQRGTKLCISRIFILQLNRNFSIILFEIRRYCLFVQTTFEFNDEIMKILIHTIHTEQANLNKKTSYEEIIDEFASYKTRKTNFIVYIY